MTQTVIKGLLAAFIILGTLQARADEKPELTLQTAPHLSTQVRDGQLIARGQISSQAPHLGYRVRLDALKSGDAPDQYLITGKQNSQNRLRVRIGQDGWVPDAEEGNGITRQTGEVQAGFDIVAQGNQTVPADEYQIKVWGAYLAP
ncbi:invasin [Escherichia coli]|nr:invasin [Escherichia coli]